MRRVFLAFGYNQKPRAEWERAMPSSVGSRCVAVSLLALGCTASAAGAQARIERIIGDSTGAMVQLAGASHDAPGAKDQVLQPGDMLTTDLKTKVELRCTTPGATTYRVDGGFRGYIDVPLNQRCTVAVVEGHTDVLAEDTTNTIGGTIPLASKGTQYAVDVTREGRTLGCTVSVYEGEVSSRSAAATATQGSRLQWVGRSPPSKATIRPPEIARSASLYASFDVAAAKAAAPDSAAPSYAQLRRLHYEVLAHPTDTATRVELAKRQIRYQVDEQAAYNLRRAKVTNDAALLRYHIDPGTIRSNAVLRDRVYRTSAVARPEGAERAAASPAATETTSAAPRAAVKAAQLQPDRVAVRAGAARARAVDGAAARAAVAAPQPAAPPPQPAAPPPQPAAPPPPPAYPGPTTDSDLQLIAAGKIDDAIRNLEARVATPEATSRDHYALAKAYDGRDGAKVREHASQAIRLHAADGKLSDAELQEVRELLATAG